MKTFDRVCFAEPQELSSGWTCAVLKAGSCATPDEAIKSGDWMPAKVPGTASQALSEAGLYSLSHPTPLHDCDVWYITSIFLKAASTLRMDGLATISEIWINGRLVAESTSMFLPVDIELKDVGHHEIAICFRSRNQTLNGIKGKRARWRTAFVDNPSLRFVRTTLLGHMPGWCPQIDIVGPYRSIKTFPRHAITRKDVDLHATYSNGRGRLETTIAFPEGMELPDLVILLCADHRVTLEISGRSAHAAFERDNIEPWWPHTHGNPKLYEVAIDIDGVVNNLGSIGFRSIEIDKGTDACCFGFVVNGVNIFARGACWTPWDLVDLPADKPTYNRALGLMRDAGFNMVRIPGMTLYGNAVFFEVADELGIMVWQDLQFANFDYPFSDENFHAIAVQEVETFLLSSRHNCSLVMLCGGSEVAQQAAMMGLPPESRKIDFFAREAQAITRRIRPDMVYIENSPSGGDLPFSVNQGVGHYYGVGAYLRPLEDARRADVSFATECLAFSNVPDAATIRAQFSEATPDPASWEHSIPRDQGASWNFEDVREFYMNLLYGVDCTSLKKQDPLRYLALSRATVAEVMESTFHEWRRPNSRTCGGVVFLWKDLQPGFGWGIIDSSGRPKSPWHALRRACKPLQLVVTDEGVNGLYVHAINEAHADRELGISLECITAAGDILASGEVTFSLAGRQARTFTGTQVLGAFFDINYAYKFGTRGHDIVVARMRDLSTSEIISDACFFPGGRGNAQYETGLKVELLEHQNVFSLNIHCSRFAQTVTIDDEFFLPSDNYFHLAPGQIKNIRLERFKENASRPSGVVSALNGLDTAHYQ